MIRRLKRDVLADLPPKRRMMRVPILPEPARTRVGLLTRRRVRTNKMPALPEAACQTKHQKVAVCPPQLWAATVLA